MPVLALNGELDVQVDAEQNLTAIAAALEKGGNRNATVHRLPKHNHLFQRAKTGLVNEYAVIEETLSDDKAKQIVGTAGSELAQAIESIFGIKSSVSETHPVSGSTRIILGAVDTSNWIRNFAGELALDRIERDGFVIKTLSESITVQDCFLLNRGDTVQ